MLSAPPFSGDPFRRPAGSGGLRALFALVAVAMLAPPGLAQETAGKLGFRGVGRTVSGPGVVRPGRPATGGRNTAERAVRDLRSRGSDEVRILRRRHAEEVYDLTVAPGASDPSPAAGAIVVPFAVSREEGTAPTQNPVPAGGARDLTAVCRRDDRSVCIARDAPVAAVGLWCARRHLEFDPRDLEDRRVAGCPESAIEAVWIRASPDRPPVRIHPPACAAVMDCGREEGAVAGGKPAG